MDNETTSQVPPSAMEQGVVGQAATPSPASAPEAGAVGDVEDAPKYTTRQWNQRQSAIDKAHAEEMKKAKQELEATRKQVAQFQQQMSSLQFQQAQATAGQQYEQQLLTNFGYPDGNAPDDVKRAAKAIAQERIRVATEEMKVNQLAATRDEQSKGIVASVIAQKYGCQINELMDSRNPDEMELKAQRLQLMREKAKFEESRKPPQDLSMPSPTGASGNWRNLSPDEKIRRALAEENKRR